MFDKGNLTVYAIAIIIIALIVWILYNINRFVFREIRKRRTALHLFFLERVNTAIILIGGFVTAFAVFGGIESVWKTMLGGTAIISAVLAFAAQDVIKDVLAGMMISIYKPFETGNRIALEDGTAGIVKDITMRHVVLQLMDTQTIIIPNSRLNAMSLRNYSYHAGYRSAPFRFYIAYGSDVEKAKQVILDAIRGSEYSIPAKETPHGPDYAAIYFTAYKDSSLEMSTTVYYEASSPSEVVISDINTRVNLALAENDIEIPFTYINVIRKN